ncbi:hypothetical protein C8R44DRAFT_734805 [Mycena epipterygia]|nr:hypothetical protein C8R44DRAFT_734805 [Mycena epipterygia]
MTISLFASETAPLPASGDVQDIMACKLHQWRSSSPARCPMSRFVFLASRLPLQAGLDKRPQACSSLGPASVLASIVGAVFAVISSAASAAAHSAHLQFSRLVNDPPSPVYLLVTLCAPAAWKRLERAGLLATMATAVHISSSQVVAAAEQDILIFPTKNGDTEECTFTGKTQEQLKGMCRDYNLTVSRNKTQLKNWDSYFKYSGQ